MKFNTKDYEELLIQLGEYDREASRIFDTIPIVKIQTWPKWNSIDLKGEGYI